jgi:hypothetical protein
MAEKVVKKNKVEVRSEILPAPEGKADVVFTGKINATTFDLAPRKVSEKEKEEDEVAQFNVAITAA